MQRRSRCGLDIVGNWQRRTMAKQGLTKVPSKNQKTPAKIPNLREVESLERS